MNWRAGFSASLRKRAEAYNSSDSASRMPFLHLGRVFHLRTVKRARSQPARPHKRVKL